MKRAAFASILLVAAGLAGAAPAPIPGDVREFLETRESCDHWRGEEGYDEERKAEIAWATCQACQGTDAKLAGLKRKYRTNARIIEKLSAFDPKIEPDNKAAAREFCRTTRKPEWQK
jgi:hypothetical protein